MMIYGGLDKFQPSPTPIEVFESEEKLAEPGKEDNLQKILSISGSKQTGYFWQLLGICEILFGWLLILQYTSFVGALFLLPITLPIFLFHAFLETDDVPSFLPTGALFLINIALVRKERKKWKPLLWIRPL
ncbi:MAG: DoxX protein [Bacteroidota bacterium]